MVDGLIILGIKYYWKKSIGLLYEMLFFFNLIKCKIDGYINKCFIL